MHNLAVAYIYIISGTGQQVVLFSPTNCYSHWQILPRWIKSCTYSYLICYAILFLHYWYFIWYHLCELLHDPHILQFRCHSEIPEVSCFSLRLSGALIHPRSSRRWCIRPVRMRWRGRWERAFTRRYKQMTTGTWTGQAFLKSWQEPTRARYPLDIRYKKCTTHSCWRGL